MSWDRTGISRGLGGLASRFNGSRRRYEWLVQAFPHASAPLLVDATHRLRRTRYRRGDVIVAEGAPADRFYIVTSGEAEVIQRVETRDVHVCTFAPGQYFGEVGLLASRPRNAFAIIVRQSYVINFLGWVATRAPTPWPLRSDGCSGNGFTSVACTLALRLQERCGTARSWARSPTIWPGASSMYRSPLSSCFTSSRPFRRHHYHGATGLPDSDARQVRIHAPVFWLGCPIVRIRQHRPVRGQPTGQRQPRFGGADCARCLVASGRYRVRRVAVDAVASGRRCRTS
jgi:Cyclic nucleotide-binding domain